MDQPQQPRNENEAPVEHQPVPSNTTGAPRRDLPNRWAIAQGKAYQLAFDESAKHALAFGRRKADQFLIRFLLRESTGMYYLEDGQLTWEEPIDATLQLQIAVCDALDERFIPGLEVYATIFDAHRNELGEHLHPLLWDPMVFHYGRNWNVASAAELSLRIRVEMPLFPRHHKAAGTRYPAPVEVEFKRFTLLPYRA